MQRFKNILFVAQAEDNVKQETAFAQAVLLAQQNQARLTVMDVAEPMTSISEYLMDFVMPAKNIQQFNVEQRIQKLEQLTEISRQQNIKSKCRVTTGTPFLEIVQAVLRDQYDLVIKTSEGSGGVDRLFGSTDLHLLRKCPCPVWIFKQDDYQETHRVLAAIDIDKRDTDKADVNVSILKLATSLAAMKNCELHIVQCWSLPSESALRYGLGHMTEDDMERLEQKTEQTYHDWLDELLDPYDIDRFKLRIHLMRGDPKLHIPQLVKKEAIDLLIMGSVNRTGIAGFFIGSTAENVFNGVDTSVLAVKPDDFVSPVVLPEHNQADSRDVA